MANESITKEDLVKMEERLARVIEKYARVNLNMEPLPYRREDKNKEKRLKVELAYFRKHYTRSKHIS